MVESSSSSSSFENNSSSNSFLKRMEQAWLISQLVAVQKNKIKMQLPLTSIALVDNREMIRTPNSGTKFVPKRMCNQGQLLVLRVNPVGMSSANGVVAQGFSFLVITCYVKYLPEILAASFVLERHLPSPIEALELAAAREALGESEREQAAQGDKGVGEPIWFYAQTIFSRGKAIHVIRSLLEEYRERQRDLHMTFLDLEKAWELIWRTLIDKGTPRRYIRVIRDMYDGAMSRVPTKIVNTEFFPVEAGLHQGSAISSYLFALILDELSRGIQEDIP
ncbi:retrovirus-related pol polyprotein LINE-1 [Tanacetum coccineum]